MRHRLLGISDVGSVRMKASRYGHDIFLGSSRLSLRSHLLELAALLGLPRDSPAILRASGTPFSLSWGGPFHSADRTNATVMLVPNFLRLIGMLFFTING